VHEQKIFQANRTSFSFLTLNLATLTLQLTFLRASGVITQSCL